MIYILPDADEDTLGPEGMEKFCEDIGVEPENVRLLFVNTVNTLKLEHLKQFMQLSKMEWFSLTVQSAIRQKADRMANSIDPDQAAA